jgi:hypothetical protein
MVISPMMIKNMIADVAKFLDEKIPGKGNGKWTKHFASGILVVDPAPLGIHADEVEFEKLFVPSNGQAGSGKRVWKYFPIIHNYTTFFTVYILDNTITKELFERYIREAGRFIGLGFFRPARRGTKGRFEVDRIEWLK